MEMFDPKSMQERIGDMPKSPTLRHLEDCERHFIKACKKVGIEFAYDVVANELPYFKTFGYTEYAHCFMMNPLQQELRLQQWEDAYADDTKADYNWTEYFSSNINNATANKYSHIKETLPSGRVFKKHLIAPVGSNKLKQTVCLNKLTYIKNTYGSANVWFKPHPLTTHALVGELKDILGDIVLDREENLYCLLQRCETLHTTHMSESAIYGACLGKRLDPIDVYQEAFKGSFYPINKHLFTQADPKAWVQRALASPKCGIVNPKLQEDWKQRIDQYVEYMMDLRESRKGHFIETIHGYRY